MHKCPPVLLLIFNRPDCVDLSFERIRAARPRQLFIAADGPRQNREGEAAKCGEARKIIESVDWPCEVKTLIRESNLGCKEAVSWFFEHVEEGIITPCSPSPFSFKALVLEIWVRKVPEAGLIPMRPQLLDC